MRLAAKTDSIEKLKLTIKGTFGEFHRKSIRSTGIRYPKELHELIVQGHMAGIGKAELILLSGMSRCSVSNSIERKHQYSEKNRGSSEKKVPPRRLEVVPNAAKSRGPQEPLIIRLPSGVVLELTDETLLTPSLLKTLAGVEFREEVQHAPSR
jgi:hypothetical protein